MPDRQIDLDSLLRLVEEVIGAGTARAEDNFFDLGGDSLHAAHLAVLLDERWGRFVDVTVVVTAETLQELHDRIVSARAAFD